MDKYSGKAEKLRSNNGFFSNPFGTSNGDHRSGQASRDAVSTNNTRGSGRCDTSASTIGSTGTVVSETFELNDFYSHFTLGQTIEREEHWEMLKADPNNFPGSMTYTIKKVRRWSLRYNDQRKKALLREVDILKKLDHPLVVKIHHFFRNEPLHLFAVLEHLEGGELLEHVTRKERYSETEVRNLCRTIMYAIDYVHSEKVVHRDIKSGSFVFANPGDKGSLKLTGFGAAYSLDDGLVVTPVGCGEELVAPEILKEQPHGTSVDMWNIGCVVHLLIDGSQPVFERKKTETYGKLSLASENWKKTSPEVKDFVSSLLEKNPSTRMTAHQAINHRWLSMEGKSLDSNDLGQNLRQIMLYKAKRELRTALRKTSCLGDYLANLIRGIRKIPTSCARTSWVSSSGRALLHMCTGQPAGPLKETSRRMSL
ncbi:unnamed protein product [Ascophyllum nodosum]